MAPTCCVVQWQERYNKKGGVPRRVFTDVSGSDDQTVEDEVENTDFPAIRRATQVITGVNPGSHRIFLITRASGGVRTCKTVTVSM